MTTHTAASPEPPAKWRAGDLPILSRLGPLRRFAEIGIADYPREVRIRLAIINVMALLIAVTSMTYVATYAS